MCTGSLGGGRRPARKRASSDPRIAEPSFLQDESSATVLQRFARGPGTGLREINGDLLGEDFSGNRRYTRREGAGHLMESALGNAPHVNRDHVVPRVLGDYNDSGRNRRRTARPEIFEKCLRATLSELGFQKWSRGCGRNGATECRFRLSSACGTN
jgi:hypothetical protein